MSKIDSHFISHIRVALFSIDESLGKVKMPLRRKIHSIYNNFAECIVFCNLFLLCNVFKTEENTAQFKFNHLRPIPSCIFVVVNKGEHTSPEKREIERESVCVCVC